MHAAKALVLTICLILAPVLPALSANTAPARGATIVFAVPKEGWPPFIVIPEGASEARGIMPDVLREICSATGYGIHFRFYPEKRIQMLLAQGKVDAYPKSPKWVDDPSLFLWTAPVLEVGDVIVYRRDAPVRFASARDLEGKSLGVIHGYLYPTLASGIRSGDVRAYSAPCTNSLLRMLARSHVDCIVTPRRVAEWLIGNEPDLAAESFGFSEKQVDSAPYGFAFAKGKGWAPFIKSFNRELRAMHRDGRMQAILDIYR